MFRDDGKSQRTDAVTSGAPESVAQRPRIVCRAIVDGDLAAAAALLSRGFPERTEAYWSRGLQRLRSRVAPEGFTRYGYVLAAGTTLLGIVLLIASEDHDGSPRVNVSSWYVDPSVRGFSTALLAPVLRRSGLTLFNISPTPSTVDTIAAQGFAPYVDGTFHALAWLAPGRRGARVRAVTAATIDAAPILARHREYGCLCYEVAHDGERHSFVFLKRRLFNDRLPGAQLIYARDTATFVRYAGLLGRHLLRHGCPIVMLDANGSVPGLVGRYFVGRRPKFFRGAVPPRLNDLHDTELVLFGP